MSRNLLMNKDFEQVVSIYDKKIDKVINKYEKNNIDAEDLKQEIYIKILKNILKFQELTAIGGWINTITSNHCKNYLRDKLKFKFIDTQISEENFNLLENIPDKSGKINVIDNKNQQEVIYKAVCSLSKKYKEVILLYDFEDYSYEKIAEELKCPVGTVKSRLFKARMLLKEQLQDFWD